MRRFLVSMIPYAIGSGIAGVLVFHFIRYLSGLVDGLKLVILVAMIFAAAVFTLYMALRWYRMLGQPSDLLAARDLRQKLDDLQKRQAQAGGDAKITMADAIEIAPAALQTTAAALPKLVTTLILALVVGSIFGLVQLFQAGIDYLNVDQTRSQTRAIRIQVLSDFSATINDMNATLAQVQQGRETIRDAMLSPRAAARLSEYAAPALLSERFEIDLCPDVPANCGSLPISGLEDAVGSTTFASDLMGFRRLQALLVEINEELNNQFRYAQVVDDAETLRSGFGGEIWELNFSEFHTLMQTMVIACRIYDRTEARDIRSVLVALSIALDTVLAAADANATTEQDRARIRSSLAELNEYFVLLDDILRDSTFSDAQLAEAGLARPADTPQDYTARLGADAVSRALRLMNLDLGRMDAQCRAEEDKHIATLNGIETTREEFFGELAAIEQEGQNPDQTLAE